MQEKIGTSLGILCDLGDAAEATVCYRPGRAGGEDLAIAAVHEDRAGALWVGSPDGLYEFDRQTGTFTAYPLDDPDGLEQKEGYAVTAIYETQDGAFWIGTARHGLVRLDPETGEQRHFRHDPEHAHSVRGGPVLALYEDRSGLLWVSTPTGLQKVFRTPFNFYQVDLRDPKDLYGGWVSAIEQDRSGTIWVGTYGGLYQLDRKKGLVAHSWHDPYNPEGLSHDYVFSIEEDQAGILWIGTLAALNRFDPQTESFTHFENDPYNSRSFSEAGYAVHADRYDSLWIGTQGGLNKLEPDSETFTRYLFADESTDAVLSIYEDRSGTLWLGTQAGLGRVEREIGSNADSTDQWGQVWDRITLFTPDSAYAHVYMANKVDAVYGDSEGQVWGFSTGLLFRFDPNRETFSRFRWLPDWTTANRRAVCLLVDEAGRPWISTLRAGLWRFNPATQIARWYDTRNGLPVDELVDRACYRNEQGEMFFGTERGLLVFHPDSLSARPAPPVALTSFTVQGRPFVFDQSIASTETIRLAYNQDSFTFTFAALDFSSPEQNLYAYMLEGYDTAWVEAGTRRAAHYTTVPYGRYVFRVKGANSDGVWSEREATIQMSIAPPFWERGWFYPLALIFGFSLIGLVVYGVRVRQLKVREQELSRMVEDRTRALVEEKKKTQAQADKLQEQADKLMEMDRLKARF